MRVKKTYNRDRIVTAKMEDVAWVIFYNPQTKKILLGKRSKKVKKSGTLGFAGGHLNSFERSKIAAAREAFEETAENTPIDKLKKIDEISDYKGKKYHYYLNIVEKYFTPVSNDGETSEFLWCKLEELEKLGDKLHKSVTLFVDHIRDTDNFNNLINNKPNKYKINPFAISSNHPDRA